MFGEASKIASLDIGNFGSAFVKVEVGHKNKKHEWFALLPQTKFMDSLDSRNGVGIRKVSFLKILDHLHIRLQNFDDLTLF